LRLTARDDAILRDVERLGPCLVEHLQRLHFPSYKTAAERAMKLFHHRYLERHALPAETGQPAMAHLLGQRGRERLAALDASVRPQAPRLHESDCLAWSVARTDILSRFIAASRHPGLDVPIVEADPCGPDDTALMPHALIVLDVPARLFRRVLLLDVAPSVLDVATMASRFDAWRAWAARPAAHIEAGIEHMLDSRALVRTRHRARVSIGLVVADDAALDRAASAAMAAGCGALVYLAARDAIEGATPLDAVWVQARARAEQGAAARRTSVLA